MHYEEVKIKSGDTIGQLIKRYGHSSSKWKVFWADQKNNSIRKKRGTPEKIQPNDIFNIPIPWTMRSKSVTKNASGKAVTCRVGRDGQRGALIRWVQTVDQSNQPIGTSSQKCVDACPPDDTAPFYWTAGELIADPTLRQNFSDVPSRNAPSILKGTTKWRAILSLAVVTEKRVTILSSIYWGFNITPAGVVARIGPRNASAIETNNHLELLRKGSGTGGTFSSAGWTFRQGTP